MQSYGVRGLLATFPVAGSVTTVLLTCKALDITGSLTFKVVYKGGEKGPCKHEWYRQNTNGRNLKALSNAEYLGLTSENKKCLHSPCFYSYMQGWVCWRNPCRCLKCCCGC
ncbi:unnamed protein product [Calypogeia fissa]